MRDTDRGYTSTLMARSDRGIGTLADLRNRRIAFGSCNCRHAAILPAYFLAQAGFLAGRDYEAVRFDWDVGKHGDTGASEAEVLSAGTNRAGRRGVYRRPVPIGDPDPVRTSGRHPRGSIGPSPAVRPIPMGIRRRAGRTHGMGAWATISRRRPADRGVWCQARLIRFERATKGFSTPPCLHRCTKTVRSASSDFSPTICAAQWGWEAFGIPRIDSNLAFREVQDTRALQKPSGRSLAAFAAAPTGFRKVWSLAQAVPSGSDCAASFHRLLGTHKSKRSREFGLLPEPDTRICARLHGSGAGGCRRPVGKLEVPAYRR